MAHIFMRVINQNDALETLLYVFKNQMVAGKRYLMLTIKHSDGCKEYIKGNIDTVFNSELANEIESGDLILLEHTNNRTLEEYLYLSGDVLSLDELASVVKDINTCCFFLMPKENKSALFIIKNNPMAKYTINKNEIISEKIYGTRADILNNVCGKIDFSKGVYTTLSTFK